jgi:PAS domain S-box-containing protein
LVATNSPERALLDSALDCVVIMDREGLVTYFNESAERTFGYKAGDALGRELAELIVPTSRRAAHRHGLARHLETGEESILGRRVELMAMRADGREFPVELTVTGIDPLHGPGFIGFVRDITERVEAERDLRAARDRIELIANEQAALRRVATLVARQATPDKLFEVVAREAAQLLGVRVTSIMRYDGDRNVTLVGVCGETAPLAVGASWPLEEAVAAGVIWSTRGPASVDVADFGGWVAAAMLSNGLRFATGVPIVVEGELWGAMTAVATDRDTLHPEVVDRLESFTELVATAVANAAARSELVGAQRRVIEAADAARARLTRDIHDGAQQQFVNALINLQLAQRKWSSNAARARELLDISASEAEAGIETLRELAAGIHPAVLSDMGFSAALEALVARMPIPVSLDVGDLELAPSLQVSIYFFCSEALTNVVKHASASSASVRVDTEDGHLRIEVHDDGVGGAEIGTGGSGLVGLRDRMAALEGTLTVSGASGEGTALVGRIPLAASGSA